MAEYAIIENGKVTNIITEWAPPKNSVRLEDGHDVGIGHEYDGKEFTIPQEKPVEIKVQKTLEDILVEKKIITPEELAQLKGDAS